MPTNPESIEAYNQNAELYAYHVSKAEESPFHAYYEKPAIRAELPELEGLGVLSLGCGSGVDSKWLLDHGAEKVTAIDISDKLLGIAKQQFPEIEFHNMDMENLDFEDESFDLAYSSLAIEYTGDWSQTLSQVHRVLKPNSLFVFSSGHPIHSAMLWENDGKTKTVKLGKEVNIETEEQTVFGDYLALDYSGIRPQKGDVAGFEVTTHHKPIGKMIDEILSSGFTIERMVEPLPLKGMQELKPNYFEMLNKIPFFIVWKIRKN